ncbi:multiple sugar transport system substrate-binding protein [Diaminobutyricimonas aerilata]|uniref:Multiple sugar transport system substrate-binding protein n=1 Tax=Diaminobutyricimonas aerilata TaxID=1162967 RepID=A0A2M9CG69_9MICO|nr:sugar ABC transporter substrate-binding protein [Diaminobutyricimonas aerilata]PJJ70845.1 multiple sugar transport system substrate-binding protein [Diaminobutyricimonas aerilata]
MKRLTTSLAAMAAVGALTLTGCSSGGGGEGGDVQLQMVETLTNPARSAVLKELIAGFEEENPGITVELVSPPTEQALTTVQQMLQAGNGVDVLEVQDSTVGPFTANKWIYDMNADLEGWDGWDALTENAKKFANPDGPTHMMPYGFYGLSLFYRTDMIEEAGFDEPPHSWEDLVEIASAVNDPASNQYGYAFRGGTNGNSNAAAIITAYAADLIDPEDAFRLADGSGTVFSTDEAQQAMDDYLELFKNGSPPSSIAWGYPEMVQGFSSGSTAFLLQDPEVIATIRDDSTLTEDQWSTTPLLVGPSGKAAQPIATAGWGIAESSEHKEEAIKLIKYLASGDAPLTFAKGNSLVPILTSAADDPFFSEGPWATYVEMNEDPDTYLNVAQPRGVAWWTEWGEKADRELQQVLLGEMTTQDLLAEWDAYWSEKYASEE